MPRAKLCLASLTSDGLLYYQAFGMSHGRICRNPRELARLYEAALFETDTTKIPSRIEEARKALVFRSSALCETSPNYDGEREDIENALYALQALENCLRSNTRDRRRVSRLA